MSTYRPVSSKNRILILVFGRKYVYNIFRSEPKVLTSKSGCRSSLNLRFRGSRRADWNCAPSMFAKLVETRVAFTGSRPSISSIWIPLSFSNISMVRVMPRGFVTSTWLSILPTLLGDQVVGLPVDLFVVQSLRRGVVLDVCDRVYRIFFPGEILGRAIGFVSETG